MRCLLRSLAALLVGMLLLAPALAAEEILTFTSDVIVNVDGSVDVTETIVVRAEGDEIRRGIYRDIPVVMLGSNGAKVRPELEVLGVSRDGDQEMYRVERMGNFQRIWIGNPDYFLDYGQHTYSIRYTMSRMARSFEDHDELYWNATGNYWIFPILSARATVTLPDGAVITELAGYTGPVGSTERAVSVKRSSDTVATFRASRALDAGEGMTVAVLFNKGVLVFPSGLDALLQGLGDLREVILPALAALLAVAYNALAWWKVGRDPEKGTIIPLFHAPKGFSPALTHYVHKWGFDNSGWTAFTAAIFDLGVKGLVEISNVGQSLRIRFTGKSPEEALPAGEQIVFDYFKSKQETLVGKANGPDLAKRRQEFTNAIESENRSRWFKNNAGYSLIGFALAIVFLGGMVWAEVLDVVWLIGSVVVGIFLAIVGGTIGGGIQAKSIFRTVWLVWVAIIGFNFFGFALESFTSLTINVASISAVSIVVVTVIFAVLMRAPTLQGRKIMDEIDGLKLYLETAEKDRMNMANEPPMTITRFERLLPYAIALGVEKPWSEHFEAELARGAVSDANGSDYSPSWYHGSASGGFGKSASGMTSMVSAAAASMTAAMVAAQPVQASSSGGSGGGGGSSGGGGGGGGGGGW